MLRLARLEAAFHRGDAWLYNGAMRYLEHTEVDAPASGVSPGMVVGTAAYTLLLGVAFIVFGLRGRQRWVAFWGATMVVAGVAYLLAALIQRA